ncbi:MAG: histidine kinase dimerization/phospho-acceptor domain-containing protein, partial [Thermodesulfovibrionales bacterium]
MAKILIIDDSIIDHDLIRLSFSRHGSGYDVTFVSTGTAGLEIVKREAFSAVFVSQYLPDMDGFKFLRRFKKLGIDLPVIMLTHDSNRKIVMRALKEGVIDTLTKSIRYFDYMPFVYERAVARFELETERYNLEGLIKRSQQQWMAIFDSITDYIFMTDSEHRIVKTNIAMAEVFKKHPRDIIGTKCYELFGIDESRLICKFPELPRTEEITIRDQIYLVSVFPLEYDGQQLYVHVMKDITEMKRLKEQLYHSDKLASLGLLVSGVAHEINNPLTGILAYAELLNMRVKDEDVRKDLEKILHSAERCKRIVENLLTFSRQRAPSRSLESINEIIDKAIELRAYWLRTGNIEIVRDYGQDIPTLYIDSQQIQQVILNLILNAEHAIVESKRERGMIKFSTSFDSRKQRVIARITDNGTGIPQDIIHRIFDP